MKILVALLASLTVAPAAEALTWKEFWEPFVEYGNHYHHHTHRFDYPPVIITRVLVDVWKKELLKKEIWVPGTWLSPTYFSEGYVEHRSRIITVPCGYHEHH
ncbi:MAG: hypothetical protein CM15mV7_0730 [uncultured marine virus]|nr:MAG: hypothetical protein CM15mV7_0730 [uncultured marine virus]